MAAITVTLHLQPHNRSFSPLRGQNGRSSNRETRAGGPNPRSSVVMGDYGDAFDEDDDDSDEEEDEERSLDLLIRFVENVFRNSRVGPGSLEQPDFNRS